MTVVVKGLISETKVGFWNFCGC